MPMYDFKCDRCGVVEEQVVPHASKGEPITHGCGGNLLFDGVGRINMGAPAHRMGAMIVDRGERKVGTVDGHFGKEAKRNRK